jgi:hypothetical protein
VLNAEVNDEVETGAIGEPNADPLRIIANQAIMVRSFARLEDWMKALLALGLLALVAPLGAGETKLGTGVNLKETTAIKMLVEQPAVYVGKTVRIDGVATAVCTHMGCWMAVAAEGPDGPDSNEKGATVRLKVDDGVIVFPVTAKGRKVSAEGVFEAVGAAAESQEAAGEHAKHDPKASQQYQLKATGAIIQ